MKNNKLFIPSIVAILGALSIMIVMSGCIDSQTFELPDSNSEIDLLLPTADFVSEQDVVEFRLYRFQNLSTESTRFNWDFSDGGTSTEQNPEYTFDGGEGTYSVTLTTSDENGETATVTKEVVVVEPEPPAVLDPVLVNFEFDKLPKISGSDCSCAGWINTAIGEQGESSSGNGGSDNVIKFDNAEPDHAYQEFAVVPNADYRVTISTSFKDIETGVTPSSLEVRILAGTGYVAGYTPVTFLETTEFPQSGWGYQSVAQVEDPVNNLAIEVISNPMEDEAYISTDFTFNSGANSSLALFIRGIGNADPEDPADFAMYGYASGEEEIRADWVIIEAVE